MDWFSETMDENRSECFVSEEAQFLSKTSFETLWAGAIMSLASSAPACLSKPSLLQHGQHRTARSDDALWADLRRLATYVDVASRVNTTPRGERFLQPNY